MLSETLEAKARDFAAMRHYGQLRKDNITPYIKHPEAVASILRGVIGISNDNLLAAAWLHDVVEDTNTPIAQIEREFGSRIAGYVAALTKTTSEYSTEYIHRICTASRGVQLIKLADVLHNACTIDRIAEPAVQQRALENTLNACRRYYLPLAKAVCPQLYTMLAKALADCRQ